MTSQTSSPPLPPPLPALGSSLLGSLTEICIVTPDLYKTASGLLGLGIGPFHIYNFNASTVSNRTFRGQPGDFELKVAFANHGPLVFEIIQPTGGASLMQEYLDAHGGQEGVQHVAFDMKGLELGERKKKMRERGFEVAMEGVWKGRKGECEFVFFDTLAGGAGTIFETIVFSEDWEDPEGEVFPAVEVGGGNA